MKPEQTIQRLLNATKNGKFAFEKYYYCKSWRGLYIQVQDMFCSYGQCGYQVFIYADPISCRHEITITHDWEMDKTEISYADNLYLTNP